MKTHTNTQVVFKMKSRSLAIIATGLSAALGIALGCTDATAEDSGQGISSRSAALIGNGEPEGVDDTAFQPGSGRGRGYRRGGPGMGNGPRHMYANGKSNFERTRRGPHRGRGPKGVPSMRLIRTALDLDTLSDAQRTTLSSLANAQRNRTRPRDKRFDNGFRTALAKSIRNGEVSASVWTEHQEQMDAMRKEHQANQNQMLNTLYQTLTDDQRNAVATQLKSRMNNRFADSPRQGRNGKSANRARAGRWGQGRFHRGGGFGQGPLGMIQNMDLTDEQRAAVDALFQSQAQKRPTDAARAAKRETMTQCQNAFLDAFASPTFDPSTARCPRFDDSERDARRQRHIDGMNGLLKILTDSQRDALADRLEATPPSQSF